MERSKEWPRRCSFCSVYDLSATKIHLFCEPNPRFHSLNPAAVLSRAIIITKFMLNSFQPFLVHVFSCTNTIREDRIRHAGLFDLLCESLCNITGIFEYLNPCWYGHDSQLYLDLWCIPIIRTSLCIGHSRYSHVLQSSLQIRAHSTAASPAPSRPTALALIHPPRVPDWLGQSSLLRIVRIAP